MVLANRAVLFVDGRYTLQGADQTDPDLIEQNVLPDPGPFNWLREQDLSGKTIGYDPRLMSPNALKELSAAADHAGGKLVAVETNPIDAAWQDRPAQPSARVVPHDLSYAGKASADKRAEIAAGLAESGLDAAVITAPASIAWLFNIRGGDVQCTPLPLGRAIVRADGSAELFLDEVKVSDGLREHLGNQVTLRPLDELTDGLGALGRCPKRAYPFVKKVPVFSRAEGRFGSSANGRRTRSYPHKIGCNGRSEFVRIRGAKLQETVRFSKFRNAVAEQMHPIPEGRENGFDLLRQIAQPGRKPAFRAFPGSSSPFVTPLQPIL